MSEFNLFGSSDHYCCIRCGVKCRVDPVPGSQAVMLKRSGQPKGLCINCAAHDVLRNLYPVNMLLAGSGPKGLALPHVQQQFEAILRSAGTDAQPGEINWDVVIANWDLPFPHKIKRRPMNPMNEEDLAREPENEKKRIGLIRQQMDDPRTPEQILEDVEKEFREKYLPLLRTNKNENS